MVHQSWVDVYMMAGIVWWLALRRDHRGWATVALTAGLMVKFTSLVLLAPAFLWSRRGRVEIVLAVVSSLLVMLPFALVTGVGTFVYSLFGYQLHLPFRTDSLSLASPPLPPDPHRAADGAPLPPPRGGSGLDRLARPPALRG